MNDVLVHRMLKNPKKRGTPTTNTKTKQNTDNSGRPPEVKQVKLALSDVDPALNTSLPASSSALLLDSFTLIYFKCLNFVPLKNGSSFLRFFGSSAFFECVVFFGFLVRDGHRNLISTDDLQNASVELLRSHQRDRQHLPWSQFQSFSWYFPTSFMLANTIEATRSL